jgi:hypothetical protein
MELDFSSNVRKRQQLEKSKYLNIKSEQQTKIQTQIHIKIFHLSAEAVITHHLSFHSSYLFREKAKASKKSRKRIKRDVMCAFKCETAASKKMTLSIFRMLHTLLYLQMSNICTKLITFCFTIFFVEKSFLFLQVQLVMFNI